ncbi:hypothetical protein Q4534_23875 [Cyclobacterium sp. 1_MG-2023]|uniref:hypothetical protein n=1 Tax=Cyclobacterium sp. 1_MG-2023 TaxID=3062681 RepID=UPI0026E268E5|nr:hypothetical protein [Cyclobacterium sp. 1_MG-2023]MDO6440485.1 hypothetical protein [Cyclobacterium sp. 1_MG-2023]
MSLVDKIKELATKQDKSPVLKKGEIQQILIQTASEVLPDFGFLTYKNGSYTFQRDRQVNNMTVKELLHIIFTLKDKSFTCSIASILNTECIFSKHYNAGLLNPHKDLKVLRNNSEALKIEDAYYFHNGQVETTTKTVKEFFGDYKKYGLPFLDKQLERLKTNEIVKSGFDYIDNLQADKEKLKSEITEELNNDGLLLSSIKHPIYVNLKENLQSVSGQSKKYRQIIPKTAHELLELYWTR